MGLFSTRADYTRKRRDEAPPGWRTVEAVVSAVETGRRGPKLRGGARVFAITATYAFRVDDGSVATITQEKRLAMDKPIVGREVVLAYDPHDPQEEIVLIRDEAETNIATAIRNKALINDGAEAVAKVLAATETGRTAAAETGTRVEKNLTLAVSPRGGDGFEVKLTSWSGAEVGDEGLYIYAPDDPGGGFPLFATPETKAMGAAGLQMVRQQYLLSIEQVLAMARNWERPESR